MQKSPNMLSAFTFNNVILNSVCNYLKIKDPGHTVFVLISITLFSC